MNLSGNYIRITKDKTVGATSSWIIPYNDRMTLSTTQITRQPIKEFFTNLADAVQAGAGDSKLAVAIGGFNFLSDLFGVKFFNKKYYASSWVGSEPCELSIKLHFFRGMTQDKWSAIQEVYTPIIQIYSNTIPNDILLNSTNTVLMRAPLPNTAQAFIDFGFDIVSTALDTLKAAINTAESMVGVLFKNTNTTNSNTTLKDALNIDTSGATTSGGKWTIEFGYSDGSDGGKNFVPYVTLQELIVTNSSFSFSETLERDDSHHYTPIDGDINLTFKSQLILTTSDIAKFQSDILKTALKA